MSETSTASADAVQTAEAAILAAAQKISGSAPAQTEAEKQSAAETIYLTWRNSYLNGIPADAFSKIEASAGALISAIVAAL